MRVDESLHPFGASARPRVAMHGGGNPEWNRRWPLRSFVELCRLLTGQARASVRLLGSRGEEPENRLIVETIRGENPAADIVDASGSPVDETAACIADADLFVGNDSGPMNFAAALGTPIVAIRGADAENFRPDTVDGRHVVLSGWTQCSRYRNGSNVCEEGCPIAYDRLSQEYPRCMENITLQSVWTAVTRQLETEAAARSPT
jgi:ADP-heptose:LPS heptosyltransferase